MLKLHYFCIAKLVITWPILARLQNVIPSRSQYFESYAFCSKSGYKKLDPFFEKFLRGFHDFFQKIHKICFPFFFLIFKYRSIGIRVLAYKWYSLLKSVVNCLKYSLKNAQKFGKCRIGKYSQYFEFSNGKNLYNSGNTCQIQICDTFPSLEHRELSVLIKMWQSKI